jgi:hypothetical protein
VRDEEESAAYTAACERTLTSLLISVVALLALLFLALLVVALISELATALGVLLWLFVNTL